MRNSAAFSSRRESPATWRRGPAISRPKKYGRSCSIFVFSTTRVRTSRSTERCTGISAASRKKTRRKSGLSAGGQTTTQQWQDMQGLNPWMRRRRTGRPVPVFPAAPTNTSAPAAARSSKNSTGAARVSLICLSMSSSNSL